MSSVSVGLAELSPRGWFGGANGGMGMNDEWHATGGYTFEMSLTDWPFLDPPGFSSFICEPLETYPIQVKAKLSCSGRYGATLSISVESYHCSGLGTHWRGRCSVASAQRRGLAYAWDGQRELVRAALAAFYGAQVHGPRTDVFNEEGEHIATFINRNDAFNSNQLPQRFYMSTPRRVGGIWVSWCRSDGSCRSSSSGDDIAARLEALIRSRADHVR